MSILTGLVIVVAMATLAQRSDQLFDFFFNEKEASIAPQNDSFALFAGESEIIDVLANDENAKPEDEANIHILVSPSCGAAEASDGGVLYISNDRCVGAQLFAYCVRRGDECASASVTVNVAAAVTGREITPLQTAQPQPRQKPQVEATQSVAASEPEADTAPARAIGYDEATRVEANKTPASREVIAAIRTVGPTATSAPRLRAPVPVIDDGGLGPVSMADATPKEEAGIFQRLFSAPSDEPASAEPTALEAPPRVAGLDQTERWRPSASPDVSQIAGGEANVETEIRIAAVQTDDARSTRERAQVEEAAQLPPSPAATASASRGTCTPDLSTRPGQGGMVRIAIQADCYASRTFALLHAGLEFDGRFDASGVAEMEIPVLEISPEISVRFDDGAVATAPLNFDLRSVEQTHRIAIAWTAPVNLDLHAFEYSAGFGADGHVWEQNPREFRDVRKPGGGFHSSFPAAAIDGQSIEVYTFWANRRTEPGFMRIVVDHASRGEVANGEFCGQGPLANPGYTVVRAERGAITDRALSGFTPANCGQSIGVDVRYSNNALADLKITE